MDLQGTIPDWHETVEARDAINQNMDQYSDECQELVLDPFECLRETNLIQNMF